MDSFFYEDDLCKLMYKQEQLHIAFASFMQQSEKYKFLKIAVDTLLQDVNAFYDEHQNENYGDDMQNVRDSLNDGLFGFIQQDCEVACECIKIIENYIKDNHLSNTLKLNFDLDTYRSENSNIRIMPMDSELRITEEEYEDLEFEFGLKHLNLRFTNAVMPRTKYFGLIGNIDEVRKNMLYAFGGKQFDLDNPGESERNSIRSSFEYSLLYKLLTFKQPDSDKYDFMENIDVVLHYLDKYLESDYYIVKNSVVSNELKQDLTEDAEHNLTSLDDLVEDKFKDYYKSLDEEQQEKTDDNESEEYQEDELNLSNENYSEEDDDIRGYLYVQEYLEDIYVFGKILKNALRDFENKYCTDIFGTWDNIVELSDNIVHKITDMLGINFSETDAYCEEQEDDIQVFLADLYTETELKNNIKNFYYNICDADYKYNENGLLYATKYMA